MLTISAAEGISCKARWDGTEKGRRSDTQEWSQDMDLGGDEQVVDSKSAKSGVRHCTRYTGLSTGKFAL